MRRGAYLPRSSRCQGSNQGRRHSHAGNRLGPPAEAGATGRDLHGEGELVLGRRRVVLAVPDLDNGSHAERKKNDAKKIETTENVLAVVRDGAGRRSDRNKPSMVCSAARCVDGARPTAGRLHACFVLESWINIRDWPCVRRANLGGLDALLAPARVHAGGLQGQGNQGAGKREGRGQERKTRIEGNAI